MVEKLTKYNVEMCHCFLGEHMETIESSDGEFFKVEDVEPILNSLQQLKAEILALHKDGVVADDMYWVGWNMAIERAAGVLKLSAV